MIDVATMEFGLYTFADVGPEIDPAQRLHDLLEEIELADQCRNTMAHEKVMRATGSIGILGCNPAFTQQRSLIQAQRRPLYRIWCPAPAVKCIVEPASGTEGIPPRTFAPVFALLEEPPG